MENVSKALLIAAGILVSVMLLSMLMITYNKISGYYQQKHDYAVMEQVEKFNREFENYNKQYIRGNELISLMNKVIDYNASQVYNESIGSERILIEIDLISDATIKQFKFNESDVQIIDGEHEDQKITNTRGYGYTNDKELIEITGISNKLISKLKNNFDIDITDTELQKLSSESQNIIIDETGVDSSFAIANRFKRAKLLKFFGGVTVGTDISEGCDITIDNETGITVKDDDGIIEGFKEVVRTYHQYTEFKRACFKCTKVEYDLKTNRIVKMNFEVQLREDDTVVFD